MAIGYRDPTIAGTNNRFPHYLNKTAPRLRVFAANQFLVAVYDIWGIRHKYTTYADRVVSDAPPRVSLIILVSARKIQGFHEEHGLRR